MISRGAPPAETRQYERDQNTGFPRVSCFARSDAPRLLRIAHFNLLFCCAFHQGIDPLDALATKDEINRAREWGQVDGNWRHVATVE
jgi:hypothetical protein